MYKIHIFNSHGDFLITGCYADFMMAKDLCSAMPETVEGRIWFVELFNKKQGQQEAEHFLSCFIYFDILTHT